MISQEFCNKAKESILDGDKDLALELAEEAVASGYDPKETIDQAFLPGIMEVGDLFESGEVFLPEVMMAAEAIKAAIGVLNEVIVNSGVEVDASAKIVMATVEADLHDIGKGIVASLLVANGFEVIDLGRDVPAEKIVQTAIDNNADFIGSSALLTTTMVHQKDIEDLLQEKGLKGKIRTIIGGAPVTVRWQNKIGADGFGENAAESVRLVKSLMKDE